MEEQKKGGPKERGCLPRECADGGWWRWEPPWDNAAEEAEQMRRTARRRGGEWDLTESNIVRVLACQVWLFCRRNVLFDDGKVFGASNSSRRKGCSLSFRLEIFICVLCRSMFDLFLANCNCMGIRFWNRSLSPSFSLSQIQCPMRINVIESSSLSSIFRILKVLSFVVIRCRLRQSEGYLSHFLQLWTVKKSSFHYYSGVQSNDQWEQAKIKVMDNGQPSIVPL